MKSSIVFIAGVLGLVLVITVLSFILQRKVFAIYRNFKFAFFYWCTNAIAVIVFMLVRYDFIKYDVATFCIEIIVVWFMAQLFSILLLPGYFLLKRLVQKKSSFEKRAVDLERRNFIKGLAISLPVATMGISAYGTFVSSKKVKLVRHDIFLKNLDGSLNGFKIAQISDTHLGLFFSVSKLKDILTRLVDEKPDVLVITGDLIDELYLVPETVSVLNEFAEKFPKGIYFSWGNHEYFRDFSLIEKALKSSKIQVLRNENRLLANSTKPLYLIGVDYPWGKDANEQKTECERMLKDGLKNVPQDATKVLLSHHPTFIDYAYEYGVDLCLTGHTHGGQIALLGQTILPVRYKYMRGMYTKDNQYGYVSTGAGSWFPFRLGCPAEVVIFTLKSE